MHKAKLSYAQLLRYLNALTEQELLVEIPEDDNTTYYHLTDKGEKYLDPIKIVVDLFK